MTEKIPPVLSEGGNVLASPLWRPLHDILIDWNEERARIEDSGFMDTQTGKMCRGENNIKAVKAIIEVVAKAQLDAAKAYYEPLLEQAQQEIDYIHIKQKALEGKLDDVELAIQQAKQEGYKQGVKDQYECQQIDLEQAKEEVAREMIDWSNEWCPHRDNDFPCPNYVPGELRLCKRDCPDCWQTLKDRKW